MKGLETTALQYAVMPPLDTNHPVTLGPPQHSSMRSWRGVGKLGAPLHPIAGILAHHLGYSHSRTKAVWRM